MHNIIVFAVIVTYNSEKYIRKCINSINSSSSKIKICIVDNGSSDSTLKILEKEYNDLTIIRNRENLGFGLANNVGIEYCLNENADFILLLNHDVYLEKFCLEELIKQSDSRRVLSPIHCKLGYKGLDNNFKNHV